MLGNESSELGLYSKYIKSRKKNSKSFEKDVGMKCQKASKQGVGIAETQS